MQRIHNYGSSLQAYSLRRLIEQLVPDAAVSFVDYEPGEILVTDVAARTPRTRAGRVVAKVTEYNRVDASLADKLRFFDHKRAYGRRYFPSIGVPPAPNRDLDLDVQVIGSDEVFNCVQANTNVGYARDLFGHRSPARKLLSYAGSFGNTTMGKIEAAGIGGQLAEDLSRFAAISVRDRNSADIVEELLGNQPSLHMDPVLTHDIMAAEPRIPRRRLLDEPYMIVYGYSGRLDASENEVLRRHARSIGATILCFGGVQGCCDKFVECSPLDLLAYFRDAEAVVTDTFHGTILSIINRRPFASIIRPSVGHHYGNEEKLGFLLDTFGLADHRIGRMSALADVLAADVDHVTVDAVLERERARARDYLLDELS